jgi:hypothetical protein
MMHTHNHALSIIHREEVMLISTVLYVIPLHFIQARISTQWLQFVSNPLNASKCVLVFTVKPP